MGSDVTKRAAYTRRIAQLCVIGAGAAALVLILRNSFDPDAYFHYQHEDRSQWEHPTVAVTLIAFATALETVLAYLVVALRRPRHLWMRALIALSILLPWGWWVSEFVVHAPGFWILHIVWVWALIAGLAFGALGSAAQHGYRLLRPVPRVGE